MEYISTRGKAQPTDSANSIIQGIASDGGLFVPAELPKFDLEKLNEVSQGPYHLFAAEILSRYLSFDKKQLTEKMELAYSRFTDPEVCPTRKLDDKLGVLELWHGPTFAFKDMALQVLPQLLTLAKDEVGEKRTQVILVATSGDTGKAALEGFCDVPGTKVIVFYPKGGVSPMQELQMVTQRGGNVSVVAVEGNFDHAQSGVKKLFADNALEGELVQAGYSFSSANSINPGRLLPQIVYYFKSYFDAVRLGIVALGEKLNFVVPTGNFGNILAAFYAREGGLPVGRLICASNRNRVLTTFFQTGLYDRRLPFYKTNSPSMDILISSNLERLLFEASGRDSALVCELMEKLSVQGHYQIPSSLQQKLGELFWADCADEDQTVAQIKDTFSRYNYCLDPHTAVAMKVAEQYREEAQEPLVVVSTASPFKFPQTVAQALGESGSDEFQLLTKLSARTGLAIPQALSELSKEPIRHTRVISPETMAEAVREILQLGA